MMVRRILLVSLALATSTWSALAEDKPAAAAAPPQPSVLVETIKEVDVASSRSFTGRVEAMEKVSLRARVEGFLLPRLFAEGSRVKKDDVLFEIDPATYKLNVALGEANLASAEAARDLAQIILDRQNDLAARNSNAISKQQLDQANANLKQAVATAKAREQDLENAKLQLGYTKIVAPFDGRVGRATYSTGEYVNTSSQSLVTLVREDPVYVTFPLPQAVRLEVRRQDKDKSQYFVQLTLADGSIYPEKGAIEFSDVTASSSTDSVAVRSKFANPNGLLIDQQVVQANVVSKQPEKKIVMPQSALLLDQQGSYALTVAPDGEVGVARLTLGKQRGTTIVVEAGLKVGDRVVVSAHQKARPGQKVIAVAQSD
ncbi:MAG: efflux RND transporter periplasmic adaptor subunit [Hyphomicrobiaceae bacterium]